MIRGMAHGCEAKGFWRTTWRNCSRWRAERPGWLSEGRRFQLVLFEFPLQLPSIGKEDFHFDRAHGQEDRSTALPPTRVLHVSCASSNYLLLEPSTIEPTTTAAIGKTTRRRLRVSLATPNQECRPGAQAGGAAQPVSDRSACRRFKAGSPSRYRETASPGAGGGGRTLGRSHRSAPPGPPSPPWLCVSPARCKTSF